MTIASITCKLPPRLHITCTMSEVGEENAQHGNVTQAQGTAAARRSKLQIAVRNHE